MNFYQVKVGCKARLQPLLRILCNRWVRVVIYAIACVTTSCIYFGWQQYSAMLIRNEAYVWKCDDQDPLNASIGALCDSQTAAVERLYYFANGSEYVSAALGGLALDHFGPRLTAVVGELLFAVAVLLVAFSSQSFQAYIPGLILSGICVNVISFPSLTVIESWPTRQALAVSIIVGAQSGASVIAPIIESIWKENPRFTYANLWGYYLLLIWLPVSLCYIVALPTSRDYSALVKAADADVETEVETADSTATGDVRASEETASSDISIQSDTKAEPHTMAVVLERRTISVKPESQLYLGMTTRKQIWKAFWRDVRTIDLLVMAVYFMLQMMQFAYYPAVVRDAVDVKISNYVGWLTPFQAIFSVIIGFCMDYTGTYIVMFGMSATLIFVSLSVAYGARQSGLQYVVGFVFIFMQSATYNLKYTFVNEMYDPFNFGKLVGLLGIMGGIGVYINIGISLSRHVQVIFLIYVGVAIFMAGCTAFLYLRQRREVNHKTLQGIEQSKRIRSVFAPDATKETV